MRNELVNVKHNIELPFHNNLYYEMISNRDNLRVIKKSTTGYYAYIHPPFLTPNKINKIYIKQVKTSRFLYYGICTPTVIGTKAPYKHPECLSYFAFDGTIYENNRQIIGTPAIYDGSTITIIADLILFRVTI